MKCMQSNVNQDIHKIVNPISGFLRLLMSPTDTPPAGVQDDLGCSSEKDCSIFEYGNWSTKSIGGTLVGGLHEKSTNINILCTLLRVGGVWPDSYPEILQHTEQDLGNHITGGNSLQQPLPLYALHWTYSSGGLHLSLLQKSSCGSIRRYKNS